LPFQKLEGNPLTLIAGEQNRNLGNDQCLGISRFRFSVRKRKPVATMLERRMNDLRAALPTIASALRQLPINCRDHRY